MVYSFNKQIGQALPDEPAFKAIHGMLAHWFNTK